MGDLKYPEIANRAGEEVLPQSDQESEIGIVESRSREGSEDSHDQHSPRTKSPLQAEIRITNGEDKSEPAKVILSRPELSLLPPRKDSAESTSNVRRYSDAVTQTAPAKEFSNEGPDRKRLRMSADGPAGLGINGVSAGTQYTQYQATSSPRLPTTSSLPLTRISAAPSVPQRSTETLPAMQTSPEFDESRSPSGQLGLPSLHDSGLKPLLDGRPPKDTNRMQLPPTSAAAVLSPPISSNMSRFPSPTDRSGSFSTKFPHGHPSPVYSNPSPAESNNMSPPSRPSVQLPSFAARQDALTPQSADSYTSSGTSPGATSDKLDIERSARVLPPLVAHPGPAILNGIFRCTHPGCTASPFQTQYLLK